MSPWCVRSGASSTAGGPTTPSTAATSTSCSKRARTRSSTRTGRLERGLPSAPDHEARSSFGSLQPPSDNLSLAGYGGLGEVGPAVGAGLRHDDPLLHRPAAHRVEVMGALDRKHLLPQGGIGELEDHVLAGQAAGGLAVRGEAVH